MNSCHIFQNAQYAKMLLWLWILTRMSLLFFRIQYDSILAQFLPKPSQYVRIAVYLYGLFQEFSIFYSYNAYAYTLCLCLVLSPNIPMPEVL